MRSEREWGIARQQYQARMEQLQSELEDTQRQLDKVKAGPGTASVQDDTNSKNHMDFAARLLAMVLPVPQ